MEARQFHLRVAGVSYRQDVVRRCSVGERLKLVPEPTNKFDPKAVMVCRLNGEQLGYIQRGRCTKKMLNLAYGYAALTVKARVRLLASACYLSKRIPPR